MSVNGHGDSRIANGAALTGMPDVLATVSHEVRMLADSAAELQDLIGNLTVADHAAPSTSIYDLQALDHLSQSLEAIAEFLAAVSKLSASSWQVDVTEASRAVRLAELGRRLNGGHAVAETAESTGDFDCFESWHLTG
jgi:hypothetical protein